MPRGRTLEQRGVTAGSGHMRGFQACSYQGLMVYAVFAFSFFFFFSYLRMGCPISIYMLHTPTSERRSMLVGFGRFRAWFLFILIAIFFFTFFIPVSHAILCFRSPYTWK